MSCTSTDPCGQPQYSSDSVNYVGPNLVCTTIETCDTITEAFQKAEAKVCSLQSTLVLLQNQLNSLTTTTSTSSTSTTSTTSTSSSTTTTTTLSTLGSIFAICRTRINVASQGSVSLRFRINGGPWTTFTSTAAPAGTFFVGGVYPLQYNNGGNLMPASSNFTGVLGDFVEMYFVNGNTLQNLRFGVGFTTPPAGTYNTYCGATNPYGFILNNLNYYFNIDSTGDDSTWTTNVLVTC